MNDELTRAEKKSQHINYGSNTFQVDTRKWRGKFQTAILLDTDDRREGGIIVNRATTWRQARKFHEDLFHILQIIIGER
jgi:hypothetical protein